MEVFVKRKCYACHTLRGKFAIKPDLAALSKKPKDVDLRRWLANPAAVDRRTIMPNFGLDSEEINALAAFVNAVNQGRIEFQPPRADRRPPSHDAKGWILHHGQEFLKDTKDCFKSGCHAQPLFCQDCHRTRLPNSHVSHPQDERLSQQVWMQQHGGATVAAFLAESRAATSERFALLRQTTSKETRFYLNAEFCQVCHNAERDCDLCHALLSHKPRGWAQRAAGPIRVRNEKLSLHAEVFNDYPLEARCLDCHTRPEVDCHTCHGMEMPHPGKGKTYAGRPHRADAAAHPGLCAKCHAQQYCDDCHFKTPPAAKFRGWTHTRKEDWLKHHDEAAIGTEARCNICHVPGRPASAPRVHKDCNGCHGLEMPHPADWTVVAHGAWLTEKGIDSSRKIHGGLVCFRCHTPQTQTYCDKCHDSAWRRGRHNN